MNWPILSFESCTRNSITRYVRRSDGQMVGWSLTFSVFGVYGRFLHYCSIFFNHCPCPPARNLGSHESGLSFNNVKVAIAGPSRTECGEVEHSIQSLSASTQISFKAYTKITLRALIPHSSKHMLKFKNKIANSY